MFKFELHNDQFGDLILPSPPGNWDSINATLERSPNLWAANREVGSSELKFYGVAYDYMKGILKSQFVDAKIELKVYWSEDLKLNDWQLLKQYNLTYHGMTDDGTTISAQINSGEIESIFEANQDTTYEIEMDDTITVKPVHLIQYGKYEAAQRIIDEDEIAESELRNWLIFTNMGTGGSEGWTNTQFFANVLRTIIPFMNLKKGNTGNFPNERGIKIEGFEGEPNEIQHFFSWDRLNEKFENQTEGIYRAKESGELRVKINTQMVLGYYVGGLRTDVEAILMMHDLLGFNTTDYNDNLKVVIKNKRESFVHKATSFYYTSQQVDGTTYGGIDYTNIWMRFNFEIDFPVSVFRKNDVYFMYYYIDTPNYIDEGASNFAGINKISQPKHDVELFAKLYGEIAVIPGISVGRAFQKIAQKMLDANDDDYVFESKWFNEQLTFASGNYRSGKTDYLTTGKAFRYNSFDPETDNCKLLSLTIKDLFDAMNNIYCLGMSISQNNRVKRVNCETRDDFFQLEYGGHIGEVAEFEEKLAEDLIYKAIDFANQQIKEEEYSNRYAFNVPFSYKCPIDKIKTSIDLQQSINTSAITLELARRAAEVEDESDFDDKVFLTKLTNDKMTLQNEVTGSYSGVPDFTYLANQDYCPARTLRYYWGWWLAGCLQFVKSKKITLEKNDFNRDFVSQRQGQAEVSTDTDLNVSTILGDERYGSGGDSRSMPRHEPFYHEFKAKMTYDLSKRLEVNRHKIFSYDTAQGRMYGFISSVPTIPGRVSEFQMIKASKYAISKI